MNRIELIEKLVKAHGFSNAEAGRVVQTFVSTIIESVKKNDGLSLTGFGSFKLVSKAARKARNPRTGETIKIGARKVPKFTPGAAFLDAVDAKRAAARAAAASDARRAPAEARPGASAASARRTLRPAARDARARRRAPPAAHGRSRARAAP